MASITLTLNVALFRHFYLLLDIARALSCDPLKIVIFHRWEYCTYSGKRLEIYVPQIEDLKMLMMWLPRL